MFTRIAIPLIGVALGGVIMALPAQAAPLSCTDARTALIAAIVAEPLDVEAIHRARLATVVACSEPIVVVSPLEVGLGLGIRVGT